MRFLKEERQTQKLNPLIWDGYGLIPEVRDKLIDISNAFITGLKDKNIPINVIDIHIVGSNASYNYSDKSDIDLHIIADLDKISQNNKNLLELIYDYYKSNFNDKHDITIKEIPVELYIEDKNSNAISSGRYSLLQNKWIDKPRYKKSVEFTPYMNKLYYYIIKNFNKIKLSKNKKDAEKLLDTLHFNRARSLNIDGENGVDNLIFKRFRSEGYLDELKKLIHEEESKELSLEDLQEMFNNNL